MASCFSRVIRDRCIDCVQSAVNRGAAARNPSCSEKLLNHASRSVLLIICILRCESVRLKRRIARRTVESFDVNVFTNACYVSPDLFGFLLPIFYPSKSPPISLVTPCVVDARQIRWRVCGCIHPSPLPATGDKNPPEMCIPTRRDRRDTTRERLEREGNRARRSSLGFFDSGTLAFFSARVSSSKVSLPVK